MTNDQLDELERLAKAATPGPWITRTLENFGWSVVHYRGGDRFDIERVSKSSEEKNAAFIAAANPAAVLELIAAARPDWQPIETHDGGRGAVLVWCAERRNTYTAIWRDDEWRGDPGWFHFAGLADRLRETPTHWMPLPAAPDASASDKLARDEAAQQRSETQDSQRIIDGLNDVRAGRFTVRSYSMPKTPPPNAGEGLRQAIERLEMVASGAVPIIRNGDPGLHDDIRTILQALRSNSPEDAR